MKREWKKILVMLMVIVMAFAMAGCITTESGEPELITVSDGQVIGEGAAEFALEIVDADGNITDVTVKTDEATVGEALYNLGVIAGDTTEYGLYIKTVNGMTYDYDIDEKYWAFYVDGAYAQKGADMTEIEADKKYSLKVE